MIQRRLFHPVFGSGPGRGSPKPNEPKWVPGFFFDSAPVSKNAFGSGLGRGKFDGLLLIWIPAKGKEVDETVT